MKREDERTRKLFQQLREEDERNAPSFAHDWNVALSRRDKPRRRWAGWRMAAAALSLAAAMVMVVMLVLSPRPTETERLVDGSRLEPIHFDMLSALLTERFRDPSIVAWSSPTDYLLKPELNPQFSLSRLEFQPLTN